MKGIVCPMKESMSAPAGLTAFVAQELSKATRDHDPAGVRTAADSNSGSVMAVQTIPVDNCPVKSSRLLGSQ